MNRINELWGKYRTWGKSGLVGDLTVSAVRVIFISVIFMGIFYALFIVGPFADSTDALSSSNDSGNENCNVTGINLHGTLIPYLPVHNENDTEFDYDVTSSEFVTGTIRQANEDERIKSIIVEVESAGGYPIAGEEISNAIKNSGKPVIAFIRGVGASAAYLSVSSSDKIFASIYSDVGGIGITGSYLNNVRKNEKDGYTFEQLNVGVYKDAGNPDKALTSEEKAIFKRDLIIAYNYFVEAVSKNRNIPLEKVRTYADGSTVMGAKAKELGLIDEIGGITEVEAYLEEQIGEKVEICWN